jgi:hypothetical protein
VREAARNLNQVEIGEKTRELRKTRENPVAGIVHGHRFLAVRALYFRDIGVPRGDSFPLRCRIVIQLQYVPTGE